MITIRDIAREAGVSVAAVSQVFSSTGRLADKTRKRVIAIARRLNYHPDRHARNLAVGRSRTLGIVVSDIENPFFTTLVKNFEAQARRHGFEAIASDTSFEVALMRRAAERMLEQKVDGVAIMTSEMSDTWLKEIVHRGIPLTCFGVDFVSKYASNISVNYAAAMRQLIEHLVHLGHRRIAYVGGPPALKSVMSRHDGYLSSVADLGLEAGPVLQVTPGLQGGYAAGLSIVQMAERPTAVLAVNDMTAVGLMNAFCEVGLQVPRDMSVTGFDNTYVAAYFIPRITTIDLHADVLGRTAADALCAAITSPAGSGKDYAMKFDLVVGKSTGPAPGRAETSTLIRQLTGRRQNRRFPGESVDDQESAHAAHR